MYTIPSSLGLTVVALLPLGWPRESSLSLLFLSFLIYKMGMSFCCSATQLCLTLCDPMAYSTPGLPVLHHLLELAQIRVHWVSDVIHFVLCHPLLLLPSIFPSIRIFFSESALCIRWPKYWSFSFSVSSTNEFLGLIFFRIDCFDLLAVQGTLKSLFQLHSSKASILWPSAFFMVQLSTSIHDYWKNPSFD